MRRMITAAVLACTTFLSVAVAAPAQAAVESVQGTFTTQFQVIQIQKSMASFVEGALVGCALNTATRQVLVASQNSVLPPVQVARAAAAVVNNVLGGAFCNAAAQIAKTMALMQITYLTFGHVYVRYQDDVHFIWLVIPANTIDTWVGPNSINTVHLHFSYP